MNSYEIKCKIKCESDERIDRVKAERIKETKSHYLFKVGKITVGEYHKAFWYEPTITVPLKRTNPDAKLYFNYVDSLFITVSSAHNVVSLYKNRVNRAIVNKDSLDEQLWLNQMMSLTYELLEKLDNYKNTKEYEVIKLDEKRKELLCNGLTFEKKDDGVKVTGMKYDDVNEIDRDILAMIGRNLLKSMNDKQLDAIHDYINELEFQLHNTGNQLPSNREDVDWKLFEK